MYKVFFQAAICKPMFQRNDGNRGYSIRFGLTRSLSVLIFLIALQPISAQYNFTFRDQINYTQNANDVWAYVSPSGTEYALVGTQTGVSIVDVSNPDAISEVQFIPGVDNVWRDVDIWQNKAYVTTESSTAGGLLVIDLSNLPASANSFYTQMGFGFTTAHTIWIDENGIGYLFGANSTGQGSGTFIVDIAGSPNAPLYLGKYNGAYVHDGYVRNDTLWSAEIFSGNFRVIDVTNKSAPVIMATQSTPNAFTHNAWPTQNGNYLFTTDEVNNSYVTAYDVSDIGNIIEIDRHQHEPGSDAIPHNVFVKDNFLVIAYYTAGVTIVDATYPYNLIEVGHYDTNLLFGGGYNGVWAIYPFLPSGNFLVSDRQEGLFVLTPTYIQACYLEGIVTNQVTGEPIPGANLQIVGVSALPATTNFSGFYATGVAQTGVYTVVVSANGFFTDTISVSLTANGVITPLNVALLPNAPCAIPPSNLSLTNLTSTSAFLSWIATPDALSYVLRYRQTGLTTWQTVPITDTFYEFNGLNAATEYECQVRAICQSGYESNYSLLQVFTTQTYCAPPIGLFASSLTPFSAKLQWNAQLNTTGFILQYRQSGVEASWITINTTFNVVTINGLIPCTNYEFAVSTNCADGQTSNFSALFFFTTATPVATFNNASLLNCALPFNLNSLITGNNGGTWSGGAYISGSIFNPSGLAPGQYSVTYTIIGTNCAPSQTGFMTITPAPDASFNTVTIEICNGAFNLNTLITGTSGGTWSGGSGYIVGNFFLPGSLSPGQYPVIYTVGAGSCQTSLTQLLEVAYCPTIVRAKLYLEGAYIAPDSMRSFLSGAALLPFEQPYHQAPWMYNGNETVSQFPANTVDWVLIALHSASNNSAVVAQKAVLLLQDGTLADVDGTTGAVFPNLPPNQSYYLVIRHRNHMAVMSATAIVPDGSLYDFTTAATQAFGTNQQKPVIGGFFALKAGDMDANGVITVADFNLYTPEASVINQYNYADLQLNGSVTVADFNLYAGNISSVGVPQIRY